MFFIAYTFKGQVHVFIYRTSENCKSLVLQDKCNIEIFLSLLPFSIEIVASISHEFKIFNLELYDEKIPSRFDTA